MRNIYDYTLKELQELEQKAIKENKQYDKMQQAEGLALGFVAFFRRRKCFM